GHKHQHHAKTERNPSFHTTMDVVLPGIILVVMAIAAFGFPAAIRKIAGEDFGVYFVLYAVPLMICCFYYARPLRFGLGIGVLLIHVLYPGQGRGTVYSARSYFGVIRVIETAPDKGELRGRLYTQLLHGTTDHGMNFLQPEDKKKHGDPKEDFSRLATTYYH